MNNVIFWRVASIVLMVGAFWGMYCGHSATAIGTHFLGMTVAAIGADILQAIKEKKV